MTDLYEYQRTLERADRDRESGKDYTPLGKPEEYESIEMYQLHKRLLEGRIAW